MAQADWTQLTGAVSGGSLLQGVTAGIARPNGGGSFVYGFASLDTTQGVGGLFANGVDFAPMAKGGSVRAAIQRGPGGGPTNFSPFIFIGLQGPNTSDLAYMLGLADEDPHHIVMRKGRLSEGLPGGVPVSSPPTQGILARSTAAYAVGTWLHLRLDMVVNLNGDVVLNAYASDLGVNPVTAPDWNPIPGISQFIDDALQVNSGSAPLLNGRGGYGMFTKDVTRRAYFDQLEIFRQN